MKPDQAEMIRVPDLELAFKKRYNRDVLVYRTFNISDQKIRVAYIRIVTPKNSYFIDEILTDEGLTDSVIVRVKDKEWTYRNYLEAEIFVADCIGDE